MPQSLSGGIKSPMDRSKGEAVVDPGSAGTSTTKVEINKCSVYLYWVEPPRKSKGKPFNGQSLGNCLQVFLRRRIKSYFNGYVLGMFEVTECISATVETENFHVIPHLVSSLKPSNK